MTRLWCTPGTLIDFDLPSRSERQLTHLNACRRYADELQQGEVLRYAIMTACRLAAQLLRRLVVAGTIAAEQQRQDLMAPLQILLSWLADRGADGYTLAHTLQVT